MGLFDKQYSDFKRFLEKKHLQGIVSESLNLNGCDWPTERNRNLVLAADTAVELGNPKDASTSFLMWVNDPEKIRHGRVSIVGPDLPALSGRQVSFGKIVIVAAPDFDADNSYDRYRELELLRYDIHLKGYMMRGVSQQQREWSRVSRDAVSRGFSFQHLGAALIDQFSKVSYVHAVETVFITAGREDVLKAKAIGDDVFKLISAMNKMAEELSFDCDTCDYNDVCGDVAELRSMRKSLKGKEAAGHA
jgi:CO dehydrogenase/acetyl-CoA synthase beta subunit